MKKLIVLLALTACVISPKGVIIGQGQITECVQTPDRSVQCTEIKSEGFSNNAVAVVGDLAETLSNGFQAAINFVFRQ